MNNEEFKKWWHRLSTVFADRCANISAEQLAIWREHMADLDLQDCITVIDRMLRGQVKLPFYWDDVPAIVTTEARQLRHERQEAWNRERWREQQAELTRRKKSTSVPNLGPLMRLMLRDPIRDGETRAQRLERHRLEIIEPWFESADAEEFDASGVGGMI